MNWHFGVKGGLGIRSAWLPKGPPSPKPSLSGIGGVFVNFSHVSFVGLQFEVLYMQKGVQAENYTALFDAVSFPLLVFFQIPKGFFTHAGFAVTYLFKQKTDSQDFETLEYDIIASVGWKFRLFKKLKLLLETRFTIAVNDIRRAPQSVRNYQFHGLIGFEI